MCNFELTQLYATEDKLEASLIPETVKLKSSDGDIPFCFESLRFVFNVSEWHTGTVRALARLELVCRKEKIQG